jgi:2-oxoglutarate dehydrogenase complex dehydrogenase (E1) component-like enzyme
MCDEDDNFPLPDETRAKRIERVSMQVVNPTTAANYFHVLRRQMRRTYRKPLIVFSPKKLLRLKEACSDISAFDDGLKFDRVLPDMNPNAAKPLDIKRVVLCSGQIYYDLEKER